MSRRRTPEQKAAWAAYMRTYRSEHPRANGRSNTQAPTARQLEILRIYADPEHGGSQERVAQLLGISRSAVYNSMQRLMRRLGVAEPAQAVMRLWVLTEASASDAKDD